MNYGYYYRDLALAWTLRFILLIALSVCLLASGGCNLSFDAKGTGSLTKDPAQSTSIIN
jgi:hypothetical protein